MEHLDGMDLSSRVTSREVRIRIKSGARGWKEYSGQECDATIYEGDGAPNPQINTEQLTPPLPKWQSISLDSIEVVTSYDPMNVTTVKALENCLMLARKEKRRTDTDLRTLAAWAHVIRFCDDAWWKEKGDGKNL
jgi:hypothetical protein